MKIVFEVTDERLIAGTEAAMRAKNEGVEPEILVDGELVPNPEFISGPEKYVEFVVLSAMDSWAKSHVDAAP